MTTKLPPSRNVLSTRALVLALGCGSLTMFHAGCGGDPTMLDEGEDDDDGGDTGSASFTAIYKSATFQECKGCHAPGAPGKVDGVEATQNWSTQAAAYTSLKSGKASGLTGNQSACNGVALIGSSSATSLLVAALDEDVRESFSVGSCDADAITDMNLKLQSDISPALLQNLKTWIDNGAPNN